MRSSFAILAMAVSAVSAQTVKTYKDSLEMTIDPNSVDLTTRSGWCGAQQNTCDTLCNDDTTKNNCNDDTLNWECTCSSNSSAPGLQYYTQTMPTFICEELFAQCISQTNTQKGSEECKTKIRSECATQNPPKNVASNDDDTSSSATDTATASASSTQSSSDASGTAESVSTTSSDAFAAPTMAPAGKGAAAAVALGMLAYLI
ncbi:pci domain-containing [Fusarium longipes]|uniref:Pci domain-containing n=1 Tax=Fusarium longipes TaxID=694270 RepID=A0A395RIL2_9HYPO|nr:pci domain-containing [Fusarium longipes]